MLTLFLLLLLFSVSFLLKYYRTVTFTVTHCSLNILFLYYLRIFNYFISLINSFFLYHPIMSFVATDDIVSILLTYLTLSFLTLFPISLLFDRKCTYLYIFGRKVQLHNFNAPKLRFLLHSSPWCATIGSCRASSAGTDRGNHCLVTTSDTLLHHSCFVITLPHSVHSVIC